MCSVHVLTMWEVASDEMANNISTRECHYEDDHFNLVRTRARFNGTHIL